MERPSKKTKKTILGLGILATLLLAGVGLAAAQENVTHETENETDNETVDDDAYGDAHDDGAREGKRGRHARGDCPDKDARADDAPAEAPNETGLAA